MLDNAPCIRLQKSPSNSRLAAPSPALRICRWVAFCVARDFGLQPAMLFAPTRGSARAAFARQVAMYLAHTGFALSFEAIARAFGRDRTTVSHACHVVEDDREDVRLDWRLAALELFCLTGSETFLRVSRMAPAERQ
jgi:hypothetical protein